MARRRNGGATLMVGVCLLLLAGCTSNDEGTEASIDEPAVVSTTLDPEPSTGDGAEADADEVTDQQPEDDAEPEAVVIDVEGGTDGAPATPSVTVPDEAVTPDDVDELAGEELEEFVARRYEAFWQVYSEARQAPTANPQADFPALADLASDEQLDQAYRDLAEMASNGEAIRAPEQSAVPGLDADGAQRIRFERLDDTAAELVTCFVNDRVSYRVSDGAIINDGVVTVKATASMVRTDGTWKLVRSRAVALDPGVAGCWLEDESNYPW